ncbi:DUF1565 domain-containing protein [Azospirillum sp. TSO22-1]|uniref:DUF1565 domain-containing protein n=1 Tax=Azospirillum sp. TSO22-1 TaxID=716789 RepID=UPI0013048067|nr:DUF1565 domain-containing protein [Azospirillum sp. TSO22-1]
MVDLYVSATGSDSNPGSKSSPFKTIQEAAEHAKAGTTVHVAPGTYLGGIHTETDGVTYVSDVKWAARIVPGSADNEHEAWNNLGDHVVIDGFEVDGSQPQGGMPWLYGVLTSGSGSAVRNVKVHDIARDSVAWSAANTGGQGGAGIMADGFNGDADITISGSLVYDIGPNGEHSTLVHGIYIGTRGRVVNNTVHDVVGDGISSWHDATDLTITCNAIRAVHGAGILIGAGNHLHGSGPNDHSLVSNNTITDSLKGIEENGDTGVNNTYRNNTLRGNGTDWSLQTGVRAAMAAEPDPGVANLFGPPALLDPGLPQDGATLMAAPGVDLPGTPRSPLDTVSALVEPPQPGYDLSGGFFMR